MSEEKSINMDDICEGVKNFLEEKHELDSQSCYFVAKKVSEDYWETILFGDDFGIGEDFDNDDKGIDSEDFDFDSDSSSIVEDTTQSVSEKTQTGGGEGETIEDKETKVSPQTPHPNKEIGLKGRGLKIKQHIKKPANTP